MNPWLAALLYGLPSFVMGVVAGWVTRREVTLEVTHMTAPKTTTTVHRVRIRRPDRALIRRVLAALAVVVLAVTLGSSLLVIHRQSELSDCLRHVYDTTSRRLNDAGRIAAEDRKAVDDMVSGVLVPGKTAEQRAQVLRDYLKGRHDRDVARGKLPPYPVTAGCPS